MHDLMAVRRAAPVGGLSPGRRPRRVPSGYPAIPALLGGEPVSDMGHTSYSPLTRPGWLTRHIGAPPSGVSTSTR